jgi:hypothetical protein
MYNAFDATQNTVMIMTTHYIMHQKYDDIGNHKNKVENKIK